jgi:hypothetical protein
VVGWRRQLDRVPRPRRSLAAGEGGGEVLLLEEETRKVRDHLAEVKGGVRVNLTVEGGDGSGDGSNVARSSGSSVTSVDERRMGLRVVSCGVQSGRKEAREKFDGEAASGISRQRRGRGWMVRDGTWRCRVGEGLGSTDGRWAAGTSPAAARAIGTETEEGGGH